jgi:hypothetical protein
MLNVATGIAFALSPWYLGYTWQPNASWNAWIVGGVVALIAITALFAFHEAGEWINGLLGLWALASPWALGFMSATTAGAAHIVAGFIIIALAAASLRSATNRPFSTVWKSVRRPVL